MKKIDSCPLCHGTDIELYIETLVQKKQKTYLHCCHCDLIFLERSQTLEPSDEKARYETHNNTIESEGYCNFLMKLGAPLVDHVKEGSQGLDFGCGPGPTLSILLEREGMKMSNFDPYFHNDQELLNNKYDFISCTEVIEHMNEPHGDIKLMSSMLKEGGLLGIMTEPPPVFDDKESFSKWWYKNDETHITFYSKKTIESFREIFGLELIHYNKSVSILRKEKLND